MLYQGQAEKNSIMTPRVVTLVEHRGCLCCSLYNKNSQRNSPKTCYGGWSLPVEPFYDCWVWQASKPLTTVHPVNFLALGFQTAMTDSSCQNCPQEKKNPFGLCEAKLIPVIMHIHAANKNNIKMIGTIILWFYDSSKCRQNLKRIVYVTGDADKLSLSQESCTALGRFSLHFLTLDEALHLTPATKPDKVSEATGKLTHALYHIHLRVHWACLVTLHITSSHCPDQLIYHSQQ